MNDSPLLRQARHSYVYHILAQRRIVVLLLLLCLVAGGYLGRKLSVGLYPGVERPRVSIYVPSSGLPPSDFYSSYGEQIEESLGNLDGVSEVRGDYGYSVGYELTFDWGIDNADAKRRVEQTFSSLAQSLPEDSRDDYEVYSYTNDSGGGTIYLGFASNTLPADSIFQLIERDLVPRFRGIKGVAQVESVAVEQLVSNVTLDRAKMRQYGISPAQVANGISSTNKSSSIANIAISNEWVDLRFKKDQLTLYEMEDLVVTERGGQPIYLKDIADIKIRYEPYEWISRIDGRTNVLVFVNPENGADLRLISRSLDQIIAQAQSHGTLMSQVRMQRILDPADYINLAIRNVVYAGFSGAILAILVVIIFLGQLRNIVMIAFSIPLTIVMSLSLLYYMGVSINMISLGGMTIATGMVVDASIVVTENIHRIRLQEPQLRAWQVVACATRQVWLPVLASTLTSVVVFLPLSFTAPLAEAILGDLAQTIVFALLCSLIIALLVVPVLAFYMFRPQDALGDGRHSAYQAGRLERLSERFAGLLTAAYHRVLRAFLARRGAQWLFISASIVLFALSLFILGPRIRQTIIGTPSSNRVVVWFKFEPGYEDQEAVVAFIDGVTKEIYDVLGAKVESVFSQSGNKSSMLSIITLSSSRHGAAALQALQQHFDERLKEFLQQKKQKGRQEAQAGGEAGAPEAMAGAADKPARGASAADMANGQSPGIQNAELEFDPAKEYHFQAFPWDPVELPLPKTQDLRLEFRGTETTQVLESLRAVTRLIDEDQKERVEAAQKALAVALAARQKQQETDKDELKENQGNRDADQQSQVSAEENPDGKNSEAADSQAGDSGATEEREAETSEEAVDADEPQEQLDVEDFMQGYRYYIDSEPSSLKGQPVLNLVARRGMIEKFSGLNLQNELSYSLQTTVKDLKVQGDKGSDTRTVQIRNPRVRNRDYQSIYNYPVQVSVDEGIQYIPLHHFVTFERDEQESSIASVDGARQFYIALYLDTEDPATPTQINAAKQDLEQLLAANPDVVMPGVSYNWFDTKKDIQDAIRSLGTALAIALLLVFALMCAQFSSYRYPLIILVTVPLGITGSIFFLWLCDSSISLNSLLGMILLGGIAVNNAIIMIDFVLLTLKERCAAAGQRSFAQLKRESIAHACSLRLTPILITMFTTLLGMLPIALALGDGMNVLQPLGIAVAGGLAVSTMFTLFMIPCLLNLIPTKRDRQLSLTLLQEYGPENMTKVDSEGDWC